MYKQSEKKPTFRIRSRNKETKYVKFSANLNYSFSFQLAMLKKEFNKKYSCEFCQKRFPTPSKLQRHQLVHSGEKPYLCFICLKGFTQRVHLNTHKKHAHPQTMLDNPPQLMLDGQPQLNIEGEDENDNIAVPEIDEEPPLAIVQT